MKSLCSFFFDGISATGGLIEVEADLVGKTGFTPPDMFSATIKTFSILFIILAIILTCFWLLKRFWPKGSGLLAGDGWIKVIATAPLAPKKMVVLVEIAGEILALGLTEAQMTVLTKITDEQVIDHLKTAQEKRIHSSPFYQQVKSLLARYCGEKERGESLVRGGVGISPPRELGSTE
jgi:flagellar protein FliO/FliZ